MLSSTSVFVTHPLSSRSSTLAHIGMQVNCPPEKEEYRAISRFRPYERLRLLRLYPRNNGVSMKRHLTGFATFYAVAFCRTFYRLFGF